MSSSTFEPAFAKTFQRTFAKTFGPITAVGNPSGAPQDFITRYELEGNDANLTQSGSIGFIGGPGNTSEGIAARAIVAGDTFDGVAGESTKYAIGTGAFSFLGWVRPLFGANITLWETGDGASGDGSFRIQARTGNSLRFRTNGTNINISSGLIIGDWNSFAVISTGSGGNIKMYLNSVLMVDTTAPTYNLTDTSSLDLMAGSRVDMDDCYFYDRDLTEPEVLTFSGTRGDFQISQISTSLHLEANDISSTNIIEASGLVSQWTDKSGNGLNATQSLGSAQPLTEVENINGLNVVQFNAAALNAEFFNLPDFSGQFSGSDNRYIAMVCREDGVNSYFINFGPNSTAERWTIRGTSMTLEISGSNSPSGLSMVTTGIYAHELDGTTLAESTFYADGVGVAGSGAVTIATNASIDNGIGSRISAASNKLIGVIGELVVLNRAPTTLEREKIEGLLAWKWFPTSDPSGAGNPNLPIGHTYKNSPPFKVVVSQTFPYTFPLTLG